jgi:hypothetical protein
MPNLNVDPPQYFVGETVRFWARDILDAAGDPVEAGDGTMLVQLIDYNDEAVASESGQPDTVDTNDWYADVNLPQSGMHDVKITVTVGDTVRISKEPFYIYP